MEKIKIAIGSDHGGYELKKYLFDELLKKGYEVTDCGTYTKDSCNYPEFAIKVATLVQRNHADYGILICNSGEGMCIAANKFDGVRCGLVYNEEVARLVKEHNNCNIIAFGANYISQEEALKDTVIFLNTKFAQGRHSVRLSIIDEIEKTN